MKNKKLVLISLLLLVGCKGQSKNSSSILSNSLNPSTSISSSNSTSISGTNSSTNSTNSSTSSKTTSTNSTSSSSSQEVLTTLTIKEVNALADKLSLDKDGNAIGAKVKFRGQYYGFYTETHGSIGNRMMYFHDGEDYIYVRTTQVNAESKLTKNSYYEITGNVEVHYNLKEVDLLTFSAVSHATIPTTQFSEVKESIHDIYEDIKLLKICDKGIVYGKMITFTAQYIAKTDNSIMLFYDGTNVISVHGDNKINNGHTIGHYYTVTGLPGQYIYKAGISYIEDTFSKIGEINYQNFKNTTAQEIYKLDQDNNKINLDYVPYLLRFNGYVGLNTKDADKDIYAFIDNLKDRVYWQSGYPNQSLHVRNWDNYSVINILDPYYQNDTKIDAIFVVYQYLTGDHAWSVHFLTDIK